MVAGVSKMKCTWPPIRSCSICGVPWYETWTALVPVSIRNSSEIRRVTLPLPMVATFNCPGLSFSSAMNSGRVEAGTVGLTSSSSSVFTSVATGVKSFIVSYGRFFSRCPLARCELTTSMIV